MTQREQYVLAAAATFKHALEILNKRSLKYTGENAPFANFESAADVADTDVLAGIMTRFGDKLGRIKEGLREYRAGSPNEWIDEPLVDSITDAINYLAILRIYLETSGGEDFQPFLEESGMIPHPQLGLPGLAEETVPEEEVGMFKRLFQR